MTIKRWARTAQYVLGMFLLLAFITKATDIFRLERQVVEIMEAFTNWSGAAIHWIAWFKTIALLLVELALGAMLVSGYGTKGAAWVALPLILLFMVFAGLRLLGILEGNCDCFGVLYKPLPAAALIENCMLAALAYIAASSQPPPKPRRRLVMAGLVSAGVLWGAFFYFFPPQWSAARQGAIWKAPAADPAIPTASNALYWLFDPDCAECLEQIRYLETITRKGLSVVVGITGCTPGRFNEFLYDSDPSFGTFRAEPTALADLSLPAGSVVQVADGKIARIWSSKEMVQLIQSLEKGR